MSLDGRLALVTGAGRGIGRAIALRLAGDGATVAVNDRDAEPAEAVAAEIEAAGGRAVACPFSVLDFDAARGAVAALGAVGILVNNAGIAAEGRSLLRTTVEEVELLHRVNVVAPLVLCQAVLPGMRDAGRGDIVMISSTAPETTAPKSGPYTMAKAAQEALAAVLGKEEARHGVRLNVVAPGLVDTRLGRLIYGRVLRATTGAEPTEQELTAPMTSPDAIAAAVAALVAADRTDPGGHRVVVEAAPAF